MPRQDIIISPTTNFPSFKKISLLFIVLSLLLLFIIVYFSLAKATLVLTLSQEPKTLTFDLSVSPTSTESDLMGRIISKELNVSQNFTVENYTEEPGLAQGKIKIINNHAEDQTLVKTTRFLSPEGILFHLKNKVVVPAGQDLVTDVYADKEGPEFNLAPTKFTIPGLSTALQQKIYAVSEEIMIGGVKKVGLLTEADVTKAQEKMPAGLNQAVKAQLAGQLLSDEIILDKLIKTQVLSQNVSPKVGEKVDNFIINDKILAEVVIVNFEALVNAAKEKYKQKNAADEKIQGWQLDNFDYQIKNLDLEKNTATLEAKLTADLLGTFDLEKFNKSEIVGFDKKGLEYYFSQFSGLKKIETNFSPFWVKTVPTLTDRIHIEVK